MHKNYQKNLGSYPILFTFVSLPYRADSPGYYDGNTRYVIEAGAVKLELFSSSVDIQIPSGKIARTLLAYISSKVVRGQFFYYLKKNIDTLKNRGLNYNASDEYYRLIHNISQYRFYFPNITDICEDIFGYKSSTNTKKCYDSLNAILRMGISATVDARLKNIHVPNKQFVICQEVLLLNSGCKKSKNYAVLTTDGIQFLLNSVPVPFDEYKNLDAIEQDLLTILLRKSYNPTLRSNYSNAISEINGILREENYTDLTSSGKADKIISNARKQINYSFLVRQIFNVDSSHKHYSRYKNKIIVALENLRERYKDSEFANCVSTISENSVSFFGTENLIGDNLNG